MALIEIDGLPNWTMVIFHGYVSHNQMVLLLDTQMVPSMVLLLDTHMLSMFSKMVPSRMPLLLPIGETQLECIRFIDTVIKQGTARQKMGHF